MSLLPAKIKSRQCETQRDQNIYLRLSINISQTFTLAEELFVAT